SGGPSGANARPPRSDGSPKGDPVNVFFTENPLGSVIVACAVAGNATAATTATPHARRRDRFMPGAKLPLSAQAVIAARSAQNNDNAMSTVSSLETQADGTATACGFRASTRGH